MPVRANSASSAFAVLSLLCGLAAAPARAEPTIHAVVVGIDSYLLPTKPLRGAVADAGDIAGALRGVGAKPLVMIDGQATRDAILAGLNGMLDRASPGDLVVFTYAGHGDLSSEQPRDQAEATGKDQVILLGGFTRQAPGNRERILDDEIGQWLDRAVAKGLRPVVVFDSCHSGTMYRSFDPRAGLASVRSAEFAIEGPDMLAAAAPPRRRKQAVTSGAFSYAAAQDNERVEEKLFASGYRGAFSVAFAEALRGKADGDGDGWLSHGELSDYLDARTAQMTDARQHPKLEPFLQSRGEKLFRVKASSSPASSSPSSSLKPAAAAPARLRLLGGDSAAAELARGLTGVVVVEDPRAPADLVWDAAKREVVSGLGDVVAYGLAPQRLGGLVEKWRALERLKSAAARPVLATRATPSDRVHKEGQPFGFVVDGVNGQALTIFNLAGDGTVQFLYPNRASDPRMVSGDYSLDGAVVTEPFGADHVVALATSETQTALHAWLKKYDGQPLPLAAAEAVLTALAADPKGRLGVQAIVTQPK